MSAKACTASWMTGAAWVMRTRAARVVIAPRFAFALPFEGGKAKVTDTGQRKEVPGSGGEHWYWESDAWYFIDTTGRKTDDPQARDATPLP